MNASLHQANWDALTMHDEEGYAALANSSHNPGPSKIVPIVVGSVIVAVLLVCGISVALWGGPTTQKETGPLSSWVTPSPYGTPPSKGKVPSPGPKPTFKVTIGNGTFSIPEDAKAGRYRTTGASEDVLDLCMFTVKKDNGTDNIVDFGSAGVGEPKNVTLKAGQVFTSTGCEPWIRR